MSYSLTSRAASAALLSLLALAAAAPTAAAEPVPVDSGAVRIDSDNCLLMRIGTQLIRCDNLTGAGVPAPLFIPELEGVIVVGSR